MNRTEQRRSTSQHTELRHRRGSGRHLPALLTALILLCAAALLTGCGSAVVDNITGNKDALQVEFTAMESTDPEFVSPTAVVVTNTGDKTAKDVEVTIYTYDADNKQLVYNEDDPATADGAFGPITDMKIIDRIEPGESFGFCFYGFYGIGRVPDHVDVQVSNVSWASPEESSEGTVTLLDYDFYQASNSASFTLRNDTDFDYDVEDPIGDHSLWVNFIERDSDGRIVGGSPTTIQYLPANSEKTIDTYLDSDQLSGLSYDKIEAYVDRYDVDPNVQQTFYDEEGNTYTREEYEEYLKSKGEL